MQKVSSVFFIILNILFLSSCLEYGDSRKGVEKKIEKNYGEIIEEYAELFDLPSEYLKALAVIECSGDKNIKPRFEEKVYRKLLKVKKNKMKNYENITPEILKNVSDSTLRDMSKSWGPFQLMGYKCVWIGIDIQELKKNSVKWGIYWINKSYGNLLRTHKYKDAFHLHNSGRMYPADGNPLTFDPDYVENGLFYLEKFHRADSIRNLRRDQVIISIDSESGDE
jgi:hypothetical protein